MENKNLRRLINKNLQKGKEEEKSQLARTKEIMRFLPDFKIIREFETCYFSLWRLRKVKKIHYILKDKNTGNITDRKFVIPLGEESK